MCTMYENNKYYSFGRGSITPYTRMQTRQPHQASKEYPLYAQCQSYNRADMERTEDRSQPKPQPL